MDGAVWQGAQGRNWAEMYPQTDRAFTGLTEQLLDLVRGLPGSAILDIGCGAGELSLAVARQRPRARVIGVDISVELVAAARQRAEGRPEVDFITADAASWSQADFTPDLLISRHGVMFFADPSAAFSHLAAISSPGAVLAFSCFRTMAENPWASAIAAMFDLPGPADRHAPGPFAFADPRYVESLLLPGGWSAVEVRPADFAYIVGFGEDPVSRALHYLSRIGPSALALAQLEGSAREDAEGRIVRWQEEHRSGELIALPAAAWLVTARRGR